MRKDNDFADVTLACEDGQQVKAHKVILAGQDRYHHINTTNINIDDININEIKSFKFHGLLGVGWGVGGCMCVWGEDVQEHFVGWSEGPKQLNQFKSKLDVVMGYPTQPIKTNVEIWGTPNLGTGEPKLA